MIPVVHKRRATDWRTCQDIEPCGKVAFYLKKRPKIGEVVDNVVLVDGGQPDYGSEIWCGSCGALILEPILCQLEIDGGLGDD